MFEKFIYLLIFLEILGKVLAIKLTTEQEKVVPVFQPFPSAILDPVSLCKEGLTNQLATFNLKDKKYVAMSLTLCGIYIYDITNITNPSVVFSDYLNKAGKTLGITINYNNTYIWAAHSTGNFYGINIQQLPFKIEVTGTSNQNLLIIKLVPWPNNDDILFLACNNQFQVFDWRNKTNGLKFMQSVDVQSVNCKKIKFIRNNTFALVTTPLRGIQFYAVNNGNDIDKMTFKYSCVLKPTFFDVNDFKVIDDNTIAVMMIYTGVYMHSMKKFFDNNAQICNTTIFPFLSQTRIQGQGGNLHLSKDSKYLYTQFRTVGIKIYDVSQSTLQIIQEIKVIQNSKDIILNDEEKLIFYSNSQSLLIFNKTTPNFNRELPNLLLNTYQMQQFNWFKESASIGSYDFDCVWREDLKSVFISRSANGVMIFNYNGQGILEEGSSVYRAPSQYSVPQMNFLPDGVTGYLPRFTNGFSIVDFSDISSPKIVKENVNMGLPIVQFGFFRFFKNKKYGVVANLVQAVIFSIKDPLNPTKVGIIDTMTYTLGEVSLHSVTLNEKEDTAFCVISTFGVVMVDIEDPEKPKLLSKYFTDGASDIKLFADQKHVIISANYNGIIIVEITNDKQLVFVSKTQLNGNCFRILQFEGDQFILVTSYEDPMISLVSISDIKNPRVIQKIGNKRIVGYYQMCINADKSELFVSGQYYLFHLNIKTQMILHTQMYELISKENTNEFTRQSLEQGTSLQIGQRIELHLVPIYQTQDIIVRKAFYYDEFVLQELPSWMSFYPSEQILRISVSKDSLKRNNEGEFIDTVSQVVFLTYQSLSKAAFINTYLKISDTDSLSLYNACQKEGFLDYQGFIQETYSSSKDFSFGAKEDTYLAKWIDKKDLVKQFIQYILNQNIVNYTTQLKITASLKVNLNNREECIKTPEQSVVVKMVVYEVTSDEIPIQSDKAKFVKKNYSGVLVLISDKQDEIQLEGSLNNINLVLKRGIKFSLNEEQVNPDKIKIQITISDYVNYNYDELIPQSKVPFLSKQSLIYISSTQNLQQEFYSKFPNGEIYIQQSFSYQISSDIFLSKDESSNSLQYKALIQQGDTYKEIPKDYWLQFSATDRVFTGTPLASKYNTDIYIQVNATDGYSYQIDSFKITPNKIPFTYAIQLAIQILGPIIGLLGLYKYKHIFYNIFFKEQYVYTKDIAYVGEFYRKQIVITDNQRLAAIKLWKFFLAKIGADNIRYQLNSEIQRPEQANNFQYISPDLEQSSQSIKNNQSQFQDEIIKKIYPFGVHSEDVHVVDKKLQNVVLFNSQNMQLEESKLMGKSHQINNDTVIEKAPEENEKNLEKSQMQQSMSPKGVQAVKKSTSYGSKLRSTIQYLSKQMNFSKSAKTRSNSDAFKQSSFIEPIFLNDGTINFSQIVKYIIEQQNLLPDNKKDVPELDLKQLENPTSILSQALYCLLVEHLLNLCSTTKNIFDCLKTLAVCSYKEIDWYKAYVNIEPQFNDVHINPYPIFTICETTLNSALVEIFTQIDKQNKLTKVKQSRKMSFSLVLIEECLKAKAYGFSIQPHKFIQATRGESLHTYKYIIHSVKAFERNNSISCCYNLYEKLDLHYQQKGLTDNDKLPVWIQGIDLINGTILFGGKPEKKDIGSIIIKIFSQDHYILRSFEIQILQKDNEQENLRAKQISIFNTSDRKDMNISFNDNVDYDMNETQQIFKKKKTMDFNNRSPVSHKSSLKKQNTNTGSFSKSTVNNSQQDEIIEDKLDRELQTQSPDSPALIPQEQQNSKQFKLYLKQESFFNDDQPMSTTQRDMSYTQREMITPEYSDQKRRIVNKKELERPIQADDSIISLKD